MTAPQIPVLRVVCSSLATLPYIRGSVMQELLAMREHLHSFNTAHGVRSALLYSAGWFFQWHEGAQAGVEKLLHIAGEDRRHRGMRVLHRSVGPAMLDESVQIVTTYGQDKPTDVARRMFHLAEGQAQESPAQPDELWRELAVPWGPVAEDIAEAALVRREVVVVTSANSGAIDLVRSLGERVRAPVTYQRFASGEPAAADVGAAYVDVPGPSRSMRVQALSRRSLALPVVQLLIRDVQCVLLLLGDHAAANEALAEDVGRLLARLGTSPALRFSVTDPRASQAAFSRLRAFGVNAAQTDAQTLAQAGPAALFELLLGTRNNRRIAEQAVAA